MSKICGVYGITNPKRRIYIGQSLDINKRWNGYKRLSCKRQPSLFNSLFKYGVENHKFEILSICIPEVKLMNKLEFIFIEHYKSTDSNFGMNCRSGGENSKLSEETKIKISKSRIGKFCGKNNPFFGRTHSEETKSKIIESNIRRGDGRHFNNSRSKPIIQYDLDKNFICEYGSLTEIERKTKYNKSNISRTCYGIYKQSYGYLWKFK